MQPLSGGSIRERLFKALVWAVRDILAVRGLSASKADYLPQRSEVSTTTRLRVGPPIADDRIGIGNQETHPLPRGGTDLITA